MLCTFLFWHSRYIQSYCHIHHNGTKMITQKPLPRFGYLKILDPNYDIYISSGQWDVINKQCIMKKKIFNHDSVATIFYDENQNNNFFISTLQKVMTFKSVICFYLALLSNHCFTQTQLDEEKEKGTNSPSYCDDKSAFSSMVKFICFLLY